MRRVVFLPGAVLPAELAYGALIAELGQDVDALPKDLELYAGAEPPADYTLGTEVAGVLREVDARGWTRFHAVGYSGGGAAALVLAARHPERVASLALVEPAWAGSWGRSDEELAFWREFESIEELSSEQFMPAFVRLALRPGVDPPPPPSGDPPPWMATRPAGILAFGRAFRADDTSREDLERFPGPVYLGLGGRSNPSHYGEIVKRLRGVFRDVEIEVFEERHHFDPPHRVEPERLAVSLEALWARAEARRAE